MSRVSYDPIVNAIIAGKKFLENISTAGLFSPSPPGSDFPVEFYENRVNSIVDIFGASLRITQWEFSGEGNNMIFNLSGVSRLTSYVFNLDSLELYVIVVDLYNRGNNYEGRIGCIL